MNKVEVGMYIRFDEEIGEITTLNKNKTICYLDVNEEYMYIVERAKQASHDITDLIEKNDIITLKNDEDVYRVSAIPNEKSGLEDFYLVFEYEELLGLEDIRVSKQEMQKQLESIMTHEKFEKEVYMIGDK